MIDQHMIWFHEPGLGRNLRDMQLTELTELVLVLVLDGERFMRRGSGVLQFLQTH